MKKTIFSIFILSLLALVLAACGGGGSAQTEFTVTMKEFQFNPSGLTVPANAQITINLDNQGTLDHNFLVMKKGADVVGSWSEEHHANIFFEQDQNPAGTTSKAVFTAPSEPGEYQFLCSVPGHLEGGMEGKITVVAP